jgi:DNA modification methylase
LWYKITSAAYEAEGNGRGFLGKPYEPNAIVKHDIEYILMERKPGGYRSPDPKTRLLSIIPAEKHSIWFSQVWEDVRGESTRHHPAPFPEELAQRLIRMFSFVGDTVLDPFVGTGTTMVAAAQTGRNSMGIEIDPSYWDFARARLNKALPSMTARRVMEFVRW